MKRSALLIILLGIIVLIFALFASQVGLCLAPEKCGPAEDAQVIEEDLVVEEGDELDGLLFHADLRSGLSVGDIPSHDDIKLSYVSQKYVNKVYESAFTFEGEARGTWFFEGDFPVRIVDGGGAEVAVAPVRAKGNWMTEDFVFFHGQIAYTYLGDYPEGYLIFEKDNPSDISELDDDLRVPVTLEVSSTDKDATIELSVYLLPPGAGGGNCDLVEPVTRTVPYTQSVGQASLKALFKGPTVAEKAAGFTTALDETQRLDSLNIKDGVAYANIYGLPSGGACYVGAARAQIEQTLLQFPTIESVVLADENGDSEEILQP